MLRKTRLVAFVAAGMLACDRPDGAVSPTDSPPSTRPIPKTGRAGAPALSDAALAGSLTNQVAAAGTGNVTTIDHGSLAGLLDDDHPQYLPVNGVRSSTNGFAVTGGGPGPIPLSGGGTRLMWYPTKAAFRAGRVQSVAWDDAQTGDASIALGMNPMASAEGAVALGYFPLATGTGSFAGGFGTQARGRASTAFGENALASGDNSTAIGHMPKASGVGSVAMGLLARASGAGSVAIGYEANTNDQAGAIVISAFVQGQYNDVKAVGPGQFAVRANRFWFGNNSNVTALPGQLIATSTGAHLTTGGTWVNSSDVNRKEHFAPVRGEEVLSKLASLPIQSWNYRDEAVSVRHMGPTAQDFRSAYGLGASETSIATVDADGIALAAAKALEQRTRDQAREIDVLRALIKQQGALLDDLRSRALFPVPR